MAGKEKLPMGIEDFEEMRTMGYYYVDKTGLIRTLLENPGKVNLFTRPRRFGKTLNMSTLKYFFENGTDPALFDGLEISRETELCGRYMGKYPVISISLKSAEGGTFEKAMKKFQSIIGTEALRFSFLSDSSRLNPTERRQYAKLIELDDTGNFSMSGELFENSLLMLSRFLHKHYGQKTVILIDEYDVPLDRAYQSGYYDAMTDFIRTLFGQALKTNSSLHLAVLTGCLRISKESIFTGLNNFNVYTIKDIQYNESFGFTDAEVRNMLEYYGFMGKYDAVQTWYDGYRFGNLAIYCPWDVISYCHALKINSAASPQNYWVNTSSNHIVKKLISRADTSVKKDIERLINGETIKKKISQELTYRDIDSKADNIWSLLYSTGYLTQSGEEDSGLTELVIPNREIRWIFVEQIQDWFETEILRDSQKLAAFCRAFQENDAPAIEEGFNAYLRKTISIRDTSVKKERKENFYHGILLGLLSSVDGWDVKSNAQSGEGYSDISIEIDAREIGIIIELKYAEKAAFEESCQNALRQIRERNYAEALIDDGMKTIYKYGIACYKKRCRVLSEP